MTGFILTFIACLLGNIVAYWGNFYLAKMRVMRAWRSRQQWVEEVWEHHAKQQDQAEANRSLN